MEKAPPGAQVLVAHAGFEPAISALRGRRPRPTRLMRHAFRIRFWLGEKDSNPHNEIQSLASYR